MPLKHSRSTVTANKAHPHKDNERGMERFAGRICSNFWVERNGEVVLSEWRVALLEAVAETGSISAAAARHGVHFRVAWRFRRFTAGLQDMIERRFAEAFEES